MWYGYKQKILRKENSNGCERDKCSKPLPIIVIEMKTTLRFYLIPVEWITSKYK